MQNLDQLYTNIYIQKAIFSIIALVGMYIVSFILKKGIDLIFVGVKHKVSSVYALSKTRTIRYLLKNVIDGVLFFLVMLTILAQWGVNIMPILTGAGVLGLAFSFGSQTLVKDIISGFFIIIDDQFNLGDYVKIGAVEGEVYRMTLRTTVLKDNDDNLVYVPNSQITTVTNYKQRPLPTKTKK